MKGETVWDPLRRKEVALTPEERVRQWFIGVLRDNLGVPVHMMRSEVEMTYGEAGKKYRADIMVYGNNAKPVAVVECKRPDVPLTREVMEQALRYNMVLDVNCIIITNGQSTSACLKNGDRFEWVGALPEYEKMNGK